MSEALSYDPVLQLRISEWSVAGPSHEARDFAPLVLRQIFPQELPLLLGAAGLELAARYGDFDGNALAGDSAIRSASHGPPMPGQSSHLELK